LLTKYRHIRPTKLLKAVGQWIKIEYDDLNELELNFGTRVITSSSAIAERSRDASCPLVVSFNSTIPRAHCSVISYFGFRFNSAYNEMLFCCLRRNVEALAAAAEFICHEKKIYTQGGPKKRGQRVLLQIFWKPHDRIAWKYCEYLFACLLIIVSFDDVTLDVIVLFIFGLTIFRDTALLAA